MQKEKDRFSKGDIRITFYEIGQVEDITILASKKGDDLASCVLTLNGYDKFYRNIIINKIPQRIRPLAINYVKEGIISHSDFVQFITS